MTAHVALSYADARQAHIDVAAATEGWGLVKRPGGRSRGRLVPARIMVESLGAIFARYRTDWVVQPNSAKLDAESAAREKRQNREKF